MATKNVKTAQSASENTELIDLIKSFFVNPDAYDRNKKLIENLIDENRIGVLSDEDTAILVMDAKSLNKENMLEWYIVAAILNRETQQIIKSKIFEAKNYNAVGNFIRKYVQCKIPTVRNVCNYPDSNSPFALKDNKICLKKTKDILIDLDTEEAIDDADAFIGKLASDDAIPKIDGEDLQKKDDTNIDVNGYVFVSKDVADTVAENFGYGDPKNLYRKLHERGFIYKTKDGRYSRRLRDTSQVELMGTDQLLGIKKDIFNKMKEGKGNNGTV